MTAWEQYYYALLKLHEQAGWPASRTVAANLTCSHATVNDVLKGKRLPRWETLGPIVKVLGGDRGRFLALWEAVERELRGTAPPPPPVITPPRSSALLDEVRAIRALMEEIVKGMPDRDAGSDRG